MSDDNVTDLKTRRMLADERRARDAASLVAAISDGREAWRSYRVYAPPGMGTPTVQLAHSDLGGRLTMTPRQAEELGAALIEAAKRARE